MKRSVPNEIRTRVAAVKGRSESQTKTTTYEVTPPSTLSNPKNTIEQAETSENRPKEGFLEFRFVGSTGRFDDQLRILFSGIVFRFKAPSDDPL
jgi:hypothetical protein